MLREGYDMTSINKINSSWYFEWKKLYSKIDKKLVFNLNESKEHRILKIGCYLYIYQNWGLGFNEVDRELSLIKEFENFGVRPDLFVNIKHKNIKVAFECGELSYPLKIRDLLSKFDIDAVIWLPFEDMKQHHYLLDYQFFIEARFSGNHPEVNGRGSFQMNTDYLYMAPKYYFTYKSLNKEWSKYPLKYYLFFKKIILKDERI